MQPPHCCFYSPCVVGRLAAAAAFQPSRPWKRGKTKCEDLKRQTGREQPSAHSGPFDAVDRRITEAPDIVVVAVYRASGGEHQPVSRETWDLEDHHIFPQTTVHLARDREQELVCQSRTLHLIT